MEKKVYVKPEIKLVETPKIDVLNVSMDLSWTGSSGANYGEGWEPTR